MTKTGTPTELHVFGLDSNLYRTPPPQNAPPSWHLSAQGLSGHGSPGFDQKWLLDGVVTARRAILSHTSVTALLTKRPLHVEMQAAIMDLLRCADLKFDLVQLRPVSLRVDVPAYKALTVQRWLLSCPTVTTVVFYDRDTDNAQAVSGAVAKMGRDFVAP